MGNANYDAEGGGGPDNSFSLSTGGLIALIVIVVVVVIAGATTATLFFIAKKREWTIKETIKKSTRKVVTVLTPRRSEFPDAVKKSRSGKKSSGRTRMKLADEVPPTPRLRSEDLEKGLPSSKASKVAAVKE